MVINYNKISLSYDTPSACASVCERIKNETIYGKTILIFRNNLKIIVLILIYIK